MQEHLTDEQLTERLTIAESSGAAAHLAACPSCREEEERLHQWLAQCRAAARAAGARPEAFWQRQQAAIAAQLEERRQPRLKWAAAVAVVVLTAALLMEKAPPVRLVDATDLDHALLVDVERSVRREVPRALEPAALLAEEISQSEETRTNP